MLLAAAFGVPMLVLFYLLRLRRKPMRVTSTMLWNQAVRDLEVNVPFRWIRPSWLLVLHALILLALLIAIGRPSIKDGGTATGRVFLLIDRSASMSAPVSRTVRSGDETRGTTREAGRAALDLAKERARELVMRFSENATPPEVTVIGFAAEPVIQGPPARDTGTIFAMIDGITPSDQPGNPAAALGLVRMLTTGGERAADEAESGDDSAAARPLAVLVTDGGDLNDRTPTAGQARVRLELVSGLSGERDPRPTEQAVDDAERRPANVAIVGFAAEREFDAPEMVRVFLRLLNTARTEASVPLVVTLDGTPIARQAVSIPPARGSAPGTAGERAESMRLAIPSGGVLGVALERDDALPADNRVFGLLPPVRRPAVMLVVPDAVRADEPPAPRDRADPLLLDVLDAIGTDGLRVIDRRRYSANAAEIESDFGLVIFDRVLPATMPKVPTLSFGTPLPLVIGRAAGPPAGPPAVPLGDRIDAAIAGRTPIVSWNRDHPVMRDAVLDTIIVGDRVRLPEDDAPLVEPGPDDPPARIGGDRTTLARGEDGPLIVATEEGIRRVTVGFATADSNWPVHFSFPIFMLSAFDWLVPGTDSAVWFDAGATIVLPVAGAADTASITDPAGRTREFAVPPETRRLSLGTPDAAGLYTVVAGTARDRFAINLLSASESRLGGMAGGSDADGGAIGGAGEGQREIWRWFVLAAGAGLLLEWLVYTLRARV